MSYLVSTAAALSTCPRCKLPTLTALDEGLNVRVDLVPLADRSAEIAALLDGRWTYTRSRGGHLIHRDAYRMADPAMTGPIHADHKCTANGPVQLLIDDAMGNT